jgi:hypothetical protein
MIADQVYTICAEHFAQMSPKERAELFGKTMADAVKTFVASKTVAAVGKKAFKTPLHKPSHNIAHVVDQFKRAKKVNPAAQLVTTDGTTVNVQPAKEKLVQLQENANQNLPGNLTHKEIVTESNLVVPQIGEKLKYIFGKATGSAHNIERSTDMAKQLSRIGIFDNASGNSYLKNHLTEALNNPNNILKIQNNGRIVRESLLMGPNGGLKMHSIWEGNKLITVELFG